MDKTHFEGCWRLAGHHNCCVSRVEELEQKVNDLQPHHLADITGHLFRCAKVNGKWNCDPRCAVKRVENLAGIIREALDQGLKEPDKMDRVLAILNDAQLAGVKPC